MGAVLKATYPVVRLAARTKCCLIVGNHTGYKQFKGTKASAQEIRDIYQGLKESYLTDYDMMLSGYAPSADAVNAVGEIAKDLKQKSSKKPGSFFWGWPSPARTYIMA